MNRITYIFVVKKNDINTVNYLIENNPLNLKKKIFVLWNNSMETYFREHGLKYLLISDYTKDINLDSLKKKLLKFVENFPHEKILNEKSQLSFVHFSFSFSSHLSLFTANMLKIVSSIIRELFSKNYPANFILLRPPHHREKKVPGMSRLRKKAKACMCVCIKA